MNPGDHGRPRTLARVCEGLLGERIASSISRAALREDPWPQPMAIGAACLPKMGATPKPLLQAFMGIYSRYIEHRSIEGKSYSTCNQRLGLGNHLCLLVGNLRKPLVGNPTCCTLSHCVCLCFV